MKTLYKRDSKGKIRQWKIVEGTSSLDNKVWGILTSDGIVGGKLKEFIFKEGVPNKQFKTSHEKALAMKKSAIDMKLRSNYFESVKDIKEEDILFMPTGCPSGMIWEDWKDKKHIKYPALASGKLDGSKMYSTWREDRVFLNTRSAIEHKNFKHIEVALADFYKDNPHIVLDGEAYNHAYHDKFEELQSIFRKESPTENERALSESVAKFYIYDVVDLNRPHLNAMERQNLLHDVFENYLDKEGHLVKWSSFVVSSEEDYDLFHEKCLDANFEGTVLKIIDAPYEQRKNKNVMKRKPLYDAEFEIIDVLEGTGTAAGIAAGVTIDLQMSDGLNAEQRALLAEDLQDAGMALGWNHKKCREMLENKENYIGKWATIEYGGITAYGKLRFPKFKALRSD